MVRSHHTTPSANGYNAWIKRDALTPWEFIAHRNTWEEARLALLAQVGVAAVEEGSYVIVPTGSHPEDMLARTKEKPKPGPHLPGFERL